MGEKLAQQQKGNTMTPKAYLQATMTIKPEDREAAAKVYTDYRQPFLDDIEERSPRSSSFATRTSRSPMTLTAWSTQGPILRATSSPRRSPRA